MAKVEWNDAVKSVSGALVKINKKSQHAADQKMILATHRVAATEDTHCNRLYIRARGKDLMQQATDIADFLAQKDTAGGKKTMKAYLWKVCGDAYDAALAGA